MTVSASEASLRILRALGAPARLEICWLLAQGEQAVADIAATLQLAQPLASHHLKALKAARLVKPRRQGSWTYYALRPEAISLLAEEFASLVSAHETAWAATTKGGGPTTRRRAPSA